MLTEYSIIFVFICIQTKADKNVSTFYIDLLDSSNKLTARSDVDYVISYINSQPISGSPLILRRNNVTNLRDGFKNAHGLFTSNVIAMIDIGDEDDFNGCVSSALTNIPIFGLIDKGNNQIRKLRLCKRSIALSADYMDYAHASITILESFQWKKVALVFEERRFYQAAYFQSVVGDKTYSIRHIQLLTYSNMTEEDTTRKVMHDLAANDVDVILLYTSETYTNSLLIKEACNPTKTYVWIIQESVPMSIQAYNSHMVVSFQLSKNLTMLPKTLHNHSSFCQDCIHLIFDAVTTATMATTKLQHLGLWLPGNTSSAINTNRERLYNEATKVGFHGHTGLIKFDRIGRRHVETLEILNLRKNTFVKVGEWIKSSPNQHISGEILPNFVKTSEANSLQGRKLSVAVIVLEPFVTKTTAKDGSIQYKGFCIDLLARLASDLKFSYEIHESLDGNYGSYKNGQWNGMVRELIDGKADMVVSDITITEAREKVIDFTTSYMYYTEDIAMKKNEIKTNDYLQFLMPFDAEVWIVLVGVLVAFTIFLFILNYLSPYGWKNEQGTQTSKEFSLFNCFWFSCSCMLQQGAEHTPKSISGRLLVGFFWFSVLIWVSTYTANLAAFFTVVSKELPIKNLEDAVNSDYQLGVSSRSHLVDFFKHTQVEFYQRVWKKMNNLPINNIEGMKWTREKRYIHLGNGPILSFQASKKPCELVTLPGLSTPKSYGIGLRHGDPHVKEISLGILHLRDTGFLEKLRNKYWSLNECTPEVSKVHYPVIGRTPVELSSMAGVFIVLGSGCVISVVTLMSEIYYYKFSKMKSERISDLSSNLFNKR